jgi:hypothetical protein
MRVLGVELGLNVFYFIGGQPIVFSLPRGCSSLLFFSLGYSFLMVFFG